MGYGRIIVTKTSENLWMSMKIFGKCVDLKWASFQSDVVNCIQVQKYTAISHWSAVENEKWSNGMLKQCTSLATYFDINAARNDQTKTNDEINKTEKSN